MISSVSNSGKPRNTVENRVANERRQGFFERAAKASPSPPGASRSASRPAPAPGSPAPRPAALAPSRRWQTTTAIDVRSCSNPRERTSWNEHRPTCVRPGPGSGSGWTVSAQRGDASVVDIESKVLAGDLLIRAVGNNFIDGFVEAFAQRVVFLAHSNRGICLGAVDVAEHFAAALAGLVDPVGEREFVGNHAVEPTRCQVAVGLVQRRVELHIGAGFAIHVFGIN